jgi:predicted ferric reductase
MNRMTPIAIRSLLLAAMVFGLMCISSNLNKYYYLQTSSAMTMQPAKGTGPTIDPIQLKLALRDLALLEKRKFEGTDVMSFRFSKKEKQQQGIENNKQSSFLDYTAGQYAFFDIGGVHNDPKGPIRHFTISSSPTEDFIMITTRIRDSPYKKRLSSLEEGTIVKVRGPQGKFILHDDYSKPAVFLSGGIGVTPFRSMIKYASKYCTIMETTR